MGHDLGQPHDDQPLELDDRSHARRAHAGSGQAAQLGIRVDMA